MPENHSVIVTPADCLNRQMPSLPIPGSPCVQVLPQHARSLYLQCVSVCVCVCVFRVSCLHPHVHTLMFCLCDSSCLCVTTFWHESDISLSLELHKMWQGNCFILLSKFTPPTASSHPYIAELVTPSRVPLNENMQERVALMQN